MEILLEKQIPLFFAGLSQNYLLNNFIPSALYQSFCPNGAKCGASRAWGGVRGEARSPPHLNLEIRHIYLMKFNNIFRIRSFHFYFIFQFCLQRFIPIFSTLIIGIKLLLAKYSANSSHRIPCKIMLAIIDYFLVV